eukprot:Em0002g922a
MHQLTVFLRDAILPSGTTFFILVDNGNGSKIELAFTLAKIALYLTPIPTEIIALIGDNVTIDCSPSDPAITVSIIISISGNKVQRFISNTHELISVVESNSGNYTCSGSAPSSTTLLADDLILTETVHIIVLPDPVVIQFNGNFVVNVSIININSNNANLTCLGTTGNGRRQWRTYNDSIDSKIRDAYQMLSDGDGAVGVANEQLTIIISANKTMLIIGDVNRYSGSFLYCTSLESGKKAVTLITQANPFVIVHPDLPPDAALGQRFEMMFVVGLNSNGISNQIQISGTGTAEVTLFLNSTVVNTERSLTKLPFSLQYKMPISTVSNGNYTITVQSSFSNKKTVASTFLTVIVPNISVTSSPINVLQSTLVNLSCVPSDKRAPIVWQYFNTSSAMFNDILNESPYSVGYNGYWLSFYTILNPASLQDLNLPSLPNQSLGIIKPSPKLLVPYVQTQGSLSFSCSLVNGSTEKVFSEHIQLNTLRDSVQMVVTFINRKPAILDCLALSGLGTPTMQRRKAGVDQLLQPGIAVENTSINVSSTQVSISVRAEVINSDEPTFTSDIVGYYKCSVSNGDISIVNIIDYYNLFTNEGSSMIKLPLGSIGIVYFQLAVLCFDGLNNLAFLYEESIVAMLQSYSLNESILITLSQNSTESNIALYVVGPTRLALYINPVTQISGGVYSIMAGGFETVLNASVTLNTTVCPANYTAGVVWNAAFENQTVQMPCTNADPKFSPATQMSQQCLPSGQWAMVDFTKCTLKSGVNEPFTLFWSSLLDEITVRDKIHAVVSKAPIMNFICVRMSYQALAIARTLPYVRFCSSTGNWGPTDVTQCESYQYKYLAEQVLLSSLEIPQGLGIVTSLFAYTQPQTVSILPLDLKDSVIIISTVLNLLIASRQQGRVTDVKDTVIILDVINNLLNETNLGGWQILQSVYPNTASSLLLSNTESYGLYVASTINTSTSIMLSRSSIVLEASKVQIAPNQADIKFPGGISDLFVNASFSSSDANIVIPGGLLFERANKSSSVPVVNMIIKNINMFLPNNGSISWSSDGMLPPSSNGSFVQCNSTHLTSFAVLLAVENFPDSEALTIISYIGCGISMAGLLATIVFFLTFKKKLIEKPHNFIHLNLAIALFLAFLVFVAGVETAKHNEAACKVVAALLQYFWLSAFCWMMCEGVMLYLMLIVVFSSLKDKWWFFFLLGWLPPLLFVVIGLAVRNDYYVVRGKDGKTISYCWMSTSEGTIWAFAAPVVLVLLINVVFLIMVLVVLFKKARPKLTEAKLAKDNRSAVMSNVYTDVKSSTTDQSENEDTHISSIMDQSDKGNTDHRSNIFTDVQSSIMDQSGKFIRGGSVYDVVLSKVAVETTHCMDAKVEESVIIECTTFCDTSK